VLASGGEAPVPQGSDFETGESIVDFDIAFSLIYVSETTLKPKGLLSHADETATIYHIISSRR
jgi:hypothetical protein